MNKAKYIFFSKKLKINNNLTKIEESYKNT